MSSLEGLLLEIAIDKFTQAVLDRLAGFTWIVLFSWPMILDPETKWHTQKTYNPKISSPNTYQMYWYSLVIEICF